MAKLKVPDDVEAGSLGVECLGCGQAKLQGMLGCSAKDIQTSQCHTQPSPRCTAAAVEGGSRSLLSPAAAVIEGGTYVFERAAYNTVNGDTLKEVCASI